jgi:hypothetical protein
MKFLCTLIVSVAALVSTVAAHAEAPRYTYVDLGNFKAVDFNDIGLVVGVLNDRPAIWQNGLVEVIQIIDPYYDQFIRINAVNNSGLIVGNSERGPFIYSNGTKTFIEHVGFDLEALSINNKGQITGQYNGSKSYPFIYQNGNIDTITIPLDGGHPSRGMVINENGWVAGIANAAYQEGVYSSRAFLYNGINVIDIAIPGAEAYGINDLGEVVGKMPDSLFLYSRGHLLQLPSIGLNDNWALDINNEHLIVGRSGGSAVLWKDSSVYDLNTLLVDSDGNSFTPMFQLQSAIKINEKGQILARGTGIGSSFTYLLTPVPEPKVSSLFFAGLVGLLFKSKRYVKVT